MWLKDNSGTVSNHCKRGYHLQVKDSRDKAINSGWRNGKLVKRAADEDPSEYSLWRWEVTGVAGGGVPSSPSASLMSSHLGGGMGSERSASISSNVSQIFFRWVLTVTSEMAILCLMPSLVLQC